MDYVRIVVFIFTIFITRVTCQYEESEDDKQMYYGKFLGRFNTFSHQVDGELYAINRTSFLLRNFFYDGSGKDTYFWVGSSNHADRRAGYPLPDEDKKTNVLKRYANSELTLTLPDNKRIGDLKWFAIYDISSATTFAEIIFAEDFEPPGSHLLSEFTRNSNGVKSDPVFAVDSKTLIISNFNYDGLGRNTYFWVGSGPVPNSKGMKIPDENGYMEPLRPYQNANITLRLPGNMTMFDVDWLSIFDIPTRENFGSILFPNELNVLPSLDKALFYHTELANCEQLHERLQLSWSLNSPPTQILIEIAGKIDVNDYMAFGINDNGFNMIGSKVIVVSMNDSKPIVEEYDISSKSVCLPIPKGTQTEYEGVCQSLLVGKKPTQIKNVKGVQFEDVIIVNFTLALPPGGIVDPFKLSEEMHLIWAIGHLNHKFEPLYHYLRNTEDIKISFERQPPIRQCFNFISGERKLTFWKPLYIANPNSFTFNLTLGPAGSLKAYEGLTGLPSPGLAWYVNGLLAPELYLKRGQKYIFAIEGGNNIQQPAFHHPFYISDDPSGGYETLSDEIKNKVNVYAGISIDYKRRPVPVAAGRLCLWEYPNLNPRNWDTFPSFGWFKQKLKLKCQDGKPYILEWTPNGTVPNVVYYNSFRQRNMGNKIHIVDVVRPSAATCIKTQFQAIYIITTLMLIYTFYYL